MPKCVSSCRDNKCLGLMVALPAENRMWANKHIGCTSTSFLTLLICLQYNDNDFWGGNVSKDVSFVPDKTSDFSMLISLRNLPSIPRAMKKLL